MRPLDRRAWGGAFAIFAIAWLLLVATAPGIPIVWDEGEYIGRASRILGWLRDGRSAFSAEAIRSHWQFVDFAEGSPAWSAIPIAAGQGLGRLTVGNWDPLLASRLGPMAVFSLACATVAVRLRKDYGTVAALAAPAALLTVPRMFSEAHFATQDGQLTAWWLVLWAIDSPMLSSARAGTVGLLLGLTSATKLTGWFAWIPVVTSRLAERRSVALRRLLVIVIVAPCVYYAVNPPLWHDPISALAGQLHRTLHRAGTYDVPTLFLGERYDVTHPLPFYNTLVWLAIVTPVPTLVLGAFGLCLCLARRTQASIGLVLHWTTMMAARALPWLPPHDGIRLFLPAFGFWCVLAAIGTQYVYDRSKVAPAAARVAIRWGLAAALIVNAIGVARYYPQTLSHYNLLIGGLRGAADRGMEPAYWWDGLDAGVLRWVNEHTPAGGAVAFSPSPEATPGGNFQLLHDWRRLYPRPVDGRQAPFSWYILQNRPGMFSDVDRALVRNATPAFAKYAGRYAIGPAVCPDLDVPLILVFSSEEYQRAAAAAGMPSFRADH
jgi:hypothetical protein